MKSFHVLLDTLWMAMYNVHVNQRKIEPEDHWSCIAHLSVEDILKSAVIEEKKFKHSPGPLGKGRQPIRAKILIWCQQEGLITMVICCKFFNLWRLYTSFHDLINVYSHRPGADNHRGRNFYVNRNLLSFRSFATSLKKNLFEVWFYTIFFMILYIYKAPRQGLTTPWSQNLDVNRNILSLWSFVASFKKISLKSDFIQFFSWFYTCIKPRSRGWQPLGDEILMSTGTSCHFGHLLQV